MTTLCALSRVPLKYFQQSVLPASDSEEEEREADFELVDNTGHEEYRCEVKLMGKGNPESADAPHARNTQVFVANTLSALE